MFDISGNVRKRAGLVMDVTPRLALAVLLLFLSVFPTWAEDYYTDEAEKELRASPLHASHVYQDVLRYAALGEHRTGTASDHQTSEWLASELESLGFSVERQKFELRQFIFESAKVSIGAHAIPAFPHWFPKLMERPIVAPLAELPDESGNAQSLVGHIAYLAPERADEWHKLDVSGLSERAAAVGALALVVAVPHPSQSIYARNAAKPYLDRSLPVPTLIVGASYAQSLAEALAQRTPVTFKFYGRVEERAYGVNVLAKLDRGGEWVVVSTPSSGWFTAAGERGGGIGLWLGAARWVAQHDSRYSYMFVSNSGHELDMLGSKYSLPRMPAPEDVKLWLHLGASIGTRRWQKTNQGFSPLNEHNGIYLFSHWRHFWTARTRFSQVPELNIWPSFILPSDRGELVHFIEAGYPAMGFVGDHLYFHTPDDKPGVSSPELLAPYAEGLVNLLESLEP